MRSFIAIAALAALASCAAPQLPPPAALRTPEALASATSLASAAGAPARAWPAENWWQGWGDTQLDALVAEALAASPDAAMARARLAAADALAVQARAALLPSLVANGTLGGQQLSKNLGIPPQFVPPGIRQFGQLNVQTGFDFDLWGRNRALLQASRGAALAAAVDAAQARLLVASNVAAAYADLAAGLERVALAERAGQIRQTTLDLTRQRVAAGLDNQGATAQAQSRLASARVDLDAAGQAVLITRHRLAALLGAGPDRGLTIAPPKLAVLPPGLPVDAGISLAARRPDVIAARLRAEAEAQRVKAAKAAFLPDLRLSAVVGQQSLGFDKLLQGNSFYTQFGPALSLPIFQGGALKGQYRGARANQDTAIAQYDATLVQALREVADAATSITALDRQLLDAKAAVAAASEARRIALLRYDGGLSSQLPVLTADDTVVASERSLTELQAQRRLADVTLVRALGGGFREGGR